MQKILITGGSGLIGKELSRQLAEKSYEIRIIGRKRPKQVNPAFSFYEWDIDKGIFDKEALVNIDYIVHLAGENISGKRWTKGQKKMIEDSRVKSSELIYQSCLENNTWPKAFISGSAIGYYGTFTSEVLISEESPVGKDFLASVCQKWERSADLFAEKKVRTVKIRTGVVLSNYGGAYVKMANVAKQGMSTTLGQGKQYVPWIHIHDLVGIFIKAIEDESMNGVFNGVSPQHLSNKELTKQIARSLNKPFFLPPLPSLFLSSIYGEMANILLKGSRVSSEKIIQQGFVFKFPTIEKALDNLKDHD
jgi:uncharacterized protein